MEKRRSSSSGWGHQKHGIVEKVSGYFYSKLQGAGTEFKPNSARQKKLQEKGHSFLKKNITEKRIEETV